MSCLLYIPKLTRQLDAFWAHPHDTPTLWVGLLFGIMCLAAQADLAQSSLLFGQGAAHHAMTSAATGTPQSHEKPRFLAQVEQCLVAGDYSSGGPYALEALLHYVVGEVMRYPDPDGKTWMMMGAMLRLALRAGYHRDPSHFPGISPFHGEMRRRTWTVIHGLDVMVSLQMGLPRLIKDGQWDTQPPRNVLDEEFDEMTVQLPPARPESEATPVMHLLAKHRMLLVVAAIADASTNVDIGKTRATTLRSQRNLKKRLQDAYNSIPDYLKFENTVNFAEDPPENTLNRLSISILLQKGIIALNWGHVMSREAQSDDAESLQAYQDCISAALRILNLQTIIDAGTQLGGHLVSLRLLLSSVVKHEFLMGTIVLTTHLNRKLTNSPLAVSDERDSEIETALRRSRDVWIRQSARSAEAARVANMLTRLFGMMKSDGLMDVDTSGLSSTLRPDDPSFALLAQYGLLNHLQDLNGLFGAGVY